MEALQIQLGTLVASQRNERLLTPHMPIRFDVEPSVEKDEVNHHVKKCFAETYGATVETFEPYILSTYNNEGITASIGFQPAVT